MVKQRPILVLSALVASFGCYVQGRRATKKQEQPPNFVFFVPDEMRASSAYGEVPMPNLDRLAAEGFRFEQCHTSHTVCSQSRAAFMVRRTPTNPLAPASCVEAILGR